MQHIRGFKVAFFFLFTLFFLKNVRAQQYEVFNTEHDDLNFIFGFSLHIQTNYLLFSYQPGIDLDANNPTPIGGPKILTQINSDVKSSLSAGFLCSKKLTKHSYIRTNVQIFLSSDKSFNYTINNAKQIFQKLPSTVLNIPFHYKYVSNRDVNFQSYFYAGPKIEFDLSSSSLERKNPDFLQLNPINFGFEAGVGLTWYFPLVNISTEIKFSNGLANLLNRTALPLSQSITNVNANIFSIGLLFED
ncbi:MAG: outer membrane beta-barrel protein [Sediminibacterium sp.]|nr:outer membrane beta-barrel protein [Sediminibacterium sp.]